MLIYSHILLYAWINRDTIKIQVQNNDHKINNYLKIEDNLFLYYR